MFKMKILKFDIIMLDVTDRGGWIFIQVHTDEGVSGLGEASQSGNDYLLMKVLKWLEVQLRGEDPLQIEVLWEKMVYELGVYSGDRVIATAISAVDQALWDIKGKVLGKPVYKLLGGFQNKVKAYASFPWWVNPKAISSYLDPALERGFKAVKVRIGKNLDWDQRVLQMVRDIGGDDLEIMADVNSG